MAERLTETNELYNKRVILNNEENQITLSNIRFDGSITKAYYWGKPIDKLAQLEDIMEKYGIEDLEQYVQKMHELEQDRDTWKRACELASSRVSWCPAKQGECDCAKENRNCTNYFYEKAKKKL